MVGLVVYCIGAIMAFGLLYASYYPIENTAKDAGMIIVGTLLSWVTVILIIYHVYTNECKQDSLP